ncbi:venom allergen 5-like isoform X2 [Nasonia vitripennis]|uniref:SCP domain-containing protein n=1 Tax=Nasonia vitripennis TaxID=7425 RepID=A0A7M7HB65_NASVI|nr:venom allergen 5-like isoform X2 [Nasonia vitripennis]
MVYNSLVYECITNSIALQFYCIIFLYNFTLQVHLAVSSSRAVGNERENPPSQINSRNGRSVRRKAGRRNNWIQINIARFQNNYSHSKQCCINISNSKAKMNQALLVVLSFFVVNEDQPVAGWTWGKSATSSSNNSINDDRARYCRICASHTMCLFPYDDPGPKCAAVENGDLEPEEIEWILQRHNSLRDGIARAWKSQYRPLPARDMMQVFWDEELAKIARRWALQCNIHEKDQCRDVEEFSVAQSVSALDLQDAGNRSEMERLKFHLRSWYSQLEPDFSNSAGVGLATPSVTNVGCGRATYSVAIDDSDVAAAVEVLVCNYGPIDDPETEDDSGCETRSRRYSELCLKLQEGFSQRGYDDAGLPHRMRTGDEASRRSLTAGNAAAATTSYLLPFLAPLLLLPLL